MEVIRLCLCGLFVAIQNEGESVRVAESLRQFLFVLNVNQHQTDKNLTTKLAVLIQLINESVGKFTNHAINKLGEYFTIVAQYRVE